MAKNIQKNAVVAVNDAGAGEILAAYIKADKKSTNFFPYVAGPAGRIFKREDIKAEKAPEDAAAIKDVLEKHLDTDFVLTGTGWMTNVESFFVSEAKKLGLKTVVYLDHWVNYRERFGYPSRNWKNNLPDEIWAGDKKALLLAKKFFGVPVKFVPNQYFLSVKKECCALEKNLVSRGKNLLYICEPVRDKRLYTEFSLLRKIFEYLVKVKFNGKVILRQHPSEEDKYREIINSFKGRLDIAVSRGRTLANDLAEAKTVIGMESMALVLGVICGKKVVSIMPDKKRKCSLLFPKIKKIKDIKKLSRALFA